MRVRINDNPPHHPPKDFVPLYAPACRWPRSRYAKPRGNKVNRENIQYGGGSSAKQHRHDVTEMREYLAMHPKAAWFDIELELHLTRKHAERLVKEALKCGNF